MRLLEPEQLPSKERYHWQNAPGKTGNKVICVKTSLDLKINFAFHEILSFNWRKIIIFPSHCFNLKNGQSQGIKKRLKRQQLNQF